MPDELIPSPGKAMMSALQRNDRVLVDRVKRQLLKRILKDTEFWYTLMRHHALFGTRDQDPAIRMTMKVLDKVLAEQREVALPPKPTRPVMIQFGASIQRGSKESREKLIAHAQVIIPNDDAETEDSDPGDDPILAESVDDPLP